VKQGLRRIYGESGLLVPYVDAAYAIGGRLIWDLNPNSWSSTRKLARMKGCHSGEKAVVLCNGPSLNCVDFDLLKGLYTFGLNKINLIFDRTDFRPSSIVAVNGHVINQNSAFFNETEIQLFLDSSGSKVVKRRDNIVFLHSTVGGGRVASNCLASVVQGYTVTVVLTQEQLQTGM
jgi:hypothetical protein